MAFFPPTAPSIVAFILIMLSLQLRAELLAEEPVRTWIDDQGREVAAVLVGKNQQSAILKIAGGMEIPFPINKLSIADQEYVSNWQSLDSEVSESSEEQPESTPHPAPSGDLPDPENLPQPDEWPTSVKVGTSIEVNETEDSEEGAWIFETEHFQFHSNAQLGKNVSSEFARLFEAVYAALDQTPLPLLNPEAEGLRVVRLFETNDQYITAGGLKGSAGCFIGQSKEVLVPLDSLGVKRVGKRFSIESREENQTLIHEIVHQLTWHWPLGQWWTEGIAEFFAGATYSPGKIKFTSHGNSLREYLKEKKGVVDDEYTARNLMGILSISNEEWNNQVAGKSPDGIRNYATAAILFYYFCHMDAEKNSGPMLAHLQAVKAGMDPAESVKTYLIRGREPDELAKDVAKAWRKHSLKLSFD